MSAKPGQSQIDPDNVFILKSIFVSENFGTWGLDRAEAGHGQGWVTV